MAPSLLDRLGLGTVRAAENARRAALRRQTEDRVIAELVQSVARREKVGAGVSGQAESASMSVPGAGV